MAAVPVSIAFHRLFCYHGSDESDSEPYLWVVGFTLDGRTITHRPDSPTLDGGPAYFFSPGSHDNIGGPMGIGSQRTLPREVGRFDTTLQPIVLSAGGQTLEVPGWIGLIGMLMEEDSTSDDGAAAAHAAIDTLIRTEMDEAVADVNLAGLAAEIAEAVAAGSDPVPAASAIFTARIDRLVDRIQRYAQSVVVNAIVSKLSFPAAIVEAADPDEFLGIGVHVFSQLDLEDTTHTTRLEFTDLVVQPGMHPEASDYAFNLHGEAWQRIEVFFEPVSDQVPPGRWQVTGISRAGRPGKQFISALGGVLPDGSPWLLPKGRVMDLIGAGTHTFFVRGGSGTEATVMVEPDPVNPFFPSLTTTPDSDTTNNLGGLPQAPVGIRHTRPVD